jgi:hypothetical protein
MNMMDKYNTMTFVQVWDDSDVFEAEYKASPFYDYEAATQSVPAKLHNSLTDQNILILFSLLYAKYGNSPIANINVNQFKYKVFSIIFKYGPAWQKKLDIQDKIREIEDVQQGSFAIYNHAFNDASAPGTDSDYISEYVNDQNTTKYKKSPLEGYMLQWEAITTDITESFINKFKVCFKTIVAPEFGPRIMSEIDEEDF